LTFASGRVDYTSEDTGAPTRNDGEKTRRRSDDAAT
jgi:hypothetical protein